MTLQTYWDTQYTGETRIYTIDISGFIPAGASATGGSTTYAQTYNGSASGSAATTITGGSALSFTTPAFSAVGQYTFTASASLSDGQLRKLVYIIRVDA